MKKNRQSKKTSSHQRTKRLESTRLSRKKIGTAVIKVVGVGGGGGNAVTRMMAGDRLRGVEFIALNTDAQDLDYVTAHRKIYIGKALTRGLGAGMNPDVGKQAAEENRSEIGEALEGADIVFVTAGFGGGTGTGGAPVVADIAKEKGILTIGIVTRPFTFEGAQRTHIAHEGINRLRDKVDALVVIPNDKIFNVIDKDTTVTRAFVHIDEILKNAVHVIAELINSPGIINVDFADIRSVMKDAGTTLIGVGVAQGPDRSNKAVSAAINSPLLDVSIEGARGVLFSVAGGKDIKMAEINDVAKAISGNLDSNAKVIFGAYHDRALKDKSIKVTVIAAGFSELASRDVKMPSLFMQPAERKMEPDILMNVGPESKDREKETAKDKKTAKNTSEKQESWEVPAFLRKKRR